jgi:hypothetical protein
MNMQKVQSQFEDRYVPVPEAGCWIWTETGRPARRTSWLLERGTRPGGRRLEQRCGNDACVNPDHLHLAD